MTDVNEASISTLTHTSSVDLDFLADDARSIIVRYVDEIADTLEDDVKDTGLLEPSAYSEMDQQLGRVRTHAAAIRKLSYDAEDTADDIDDVNVAVYEDSRRELIDAFTKLQNIDGMNGDVRGTLETETSQALRLLRAAPKY